MMENDWKEIKNTTSKLVKIQEENVQISIALIANKLDALDEITRKKATGKGTPGPGCSQKVDSTELIEATCWIKILGSFGHEGRCNEVIVKTLDQLIEALNYEGYNLKCSTVYLDLLPRNSRTLEGKWHVHTAPVKHCKSQNSKHSSHISIKFSTNLALQFWGQKKLLFIQWMTKLSSNWHHSSKATNSHGISSYFAWPWFWCWL